MNPFTRVRRPAKVAWSTACALALAGAAGIQPLRATQPGPAAPARGQPVEGPGLVVLVVVDQLRADLLTRYDDLFQGGFRRLLDEGRVFRNATHDHRVTETAPGHATLATGVHPSRHGVVGNYWWTREGGQWTGVENVVDPEVALVGESQYAGASPRVLLREGVADWLRESRPDARVVALSGKDRGAVLLAGGAGDRVYWLEPAFGRFHTSTWYDDRDPGWVRRFNEKVLPELVEEEWRSTVPASARHRSRPDTAPFEGDGVHTAFPHRWADHRRGGEGPELTTWWGGTPGPDRALLLLAREAVESEGLGEDATPDLLALSLSQTDHIGHGYGPLSREQLDNLLRLDGELGLFLGWLDERLGPGGWSLVLTSDHGAQDAPETVPGGLRLASDSLATVQAAVDRALDPEARSADETPAQALVRAVTGIPWIARAWTPAELRSDAPADSMTLFARRSWHPERPTGLLGRLGLQILYEPGVLPFGYEHGSTHQTGYHHDRHVPLIVVGPGVGKGTVDEPVGAVDVAPTLAVLLGIEPPADLDGKALRLR